MYVTNSSYVKLQRNVINGGWLEDGRKGELYNVGVELDANEDTSSVAYLLAIENTVTNNAISGYWLGPYSSNIEIRGDQVNANGMVGIELYGPGPLQSTTTVLSVRNVTATANNKDLPPTKSGSLPAQEFRGAPLALEFVPSFAHHTTQTGGAACVENGSLSPDPASTNYWTYYLSQACPQQVF
jgi:hypothetical protein